MYERRWTLQTRVKRPLAKQRSTDKKYFNLQYFREKAMSVKTGIAFLLPLDGEAALSSANLTSKYFIC